MEYNPDKTYPMVIGHRIVEMSGRQLNEMKAREPANLTKNQYDRIIDRITRLEKALGINNE
jgi:hypothetical protein